MGLGFLQLLLIPIALIALGYQVFMYFKEDQTKGKGVKVDNDPSSAVHGNDIEKPYEGVFDNTYDRYDMSGGVSLDE